MIVNRIAPFAAAVALAIPGAAGATTLHTLLNTVLESGNTGQTLSSGYTTMETAQLKCPNSSCTVSMNVMATVGEATCADEWKIIGLMDGNSVDGGPYVGLLPGSGRTQVRNWQGQYVISNGKHTAAFQIYVPCDANAYQWSVSYTVTTP